MVLLGLNVLGDLDHVEVVVPSEVGEKVLYLAAGVLVVGVGGDEDEEKEAAAQMALQVVVTGSDRGGRRLLRLCAISEEGQLLERSLLSKFTHRPEKQRLALFKAENCKKL